MLWLISISILLMGASIFLQKHANIEAKSWRKLFTNPRWLVAVLLALAAFLVYFIVLGSERLTIVQPLISIHIIVAMILAAIFFKEKISKTDVIGFITIFIGLLMISGVVMI
ncbi:MAG: EamA family transporter [Candidatus Aenigmatarchaeota archaeon]